MKIQILFIPQADAEYKMSSAHHVYTEAFGFYITMCAEHLICFETISCVN